MATTGATSRRQAGELPAPAPARPWRRARRVAVPAPERRRVLHLHGVPRGGRHRPRLLRLRPAVRPGVQRPAELQGPRQRRRLPRGGGQHPLLHPGQRPALGRPGARRRAAGEPRAARRRDLPDDLPPALCHRHGGGRARVAVDLPARGGPDEHHARVGGHRRPGLAHEQDVGDAGADHHERLEELRIQHGDLPRGAAGDPAAPLRRREGRRRDGVEALRAHHAADALPHHAVRDGDLASSAPSRSSTRRW